MGSSSGRSGLGSTLMSFATGFDGWASTDCRLMRSGASREPCVMLPGFSIVWAYVAYAQSANAPLSCWLALANCEQWRLLLTTACCRALQGLPPVRGTGQRIFVALFIFVATAAAAAAAKHFSLLYSSGNVKLTAQIHKHRPGRQTYKHACECVRVCVFDCMLIYSLHTAGSPGTAPFLFKRAPRLIDRATKVDLSFRADCWYPTQKAAYTNCNAICPSFFN